MELGSIDARIVTSVCLWIIGCIVAGWAVRLWWTHPVNRAFLLGPYFTEAGLEKAIQAMPLVFLCGLLSVASGTSKFIFWLRWHGHLTDETAAIAGMLEAAFSLWVAGTFLIAAMKGVPSWLRRP